MKNKVLNNLLIVLDIVSYIALVALSAFWAIASVCVFVLFIIDGWCIFDLVASCCLAFLAYFTWTILKP